MGDERGKYVSGEGIAKFPTAELRNIVVQEITRQNLRRVFSRPLERMTYLQYDNPKDDSFPAPLPYIVEWRGNVNA